MNRDYRFDVVRAISCLFIVLTHILQGYNNEFAFWTNSAVCSFFMLSGVLLANSKVDNYSSWLKRRFRRILIPYYVVTIPMIIIYVFFSKIKLLTIVVLLTNMSGIFGALSGFGHLWFLTGIMFAYLITPVILKYKSIKVFIFVLLGIATLYLLKIFSFILTAGTICYFIGLFFDNKLKEKNDILYYLFFVSTIVLITVNLYFKSSIVISRVRYPILGILLFYLLYHSKILTPIIITQFKGLLEWISRKSYIIYLVHGFFADGVFSLLNVFSSTGVNIVLFLLATIIFSYFISHIVGKIESKAT